jgi:hypothetical protein
MFLRYFSIKSLYLEFIKLALSYTYCGLIPNEGWKIIGNRRITIRADDKQYLLRFKRQYKLSNFRPSYLQTFCF